MPVLVDIGTLVTPRTGARQGELALLPDAAVAYRNGVITWLGAQRDLPASEDDGQRVSAEGGLVIPGLVDAHTHLAFGGWRADEWARRLAGTTYVEIARAGGGIARTVALTRAMDDEQLLARAASFATEMAALGITTVEAKSGYGLDRETEVRTLHAYAALDRRGPLRVVPTYLGAHVVPPEFRTDRRAYVDLVIEMVAYVAQRRLARFVDVFVEESAFSANEAREIARATAAAGLSLKVHADQLASGGGAELAAELGAVSADHLERISDAGVAALARAGTIAVVLPIAALWLDAPSPPARRLIEAGVPVAVATDFNPGTAPTFHLPFALTLACVRGRMTPAEALDGATRIAARAVGMEADIGVLEPGKQADLAVLDAPDVEHWLYHLRANACRRTLRGGEVTWSA
jgi:imidazolonepropionase